MKRGLIFIGITLCALLIGTLVISVTSPKSEGLSQSSIMPSSFDEATTYKGDSYLFSNGRGFISYKPSTNTSDVIGKEYASNELEAIDSIQASDNGSYILFHSFLVPKNGVLDTLLAAKNLPNEGSYWWLFNVQSGQFSLVSSDATQAKFSGESILLVRPTNTGFVIEQRTIIGNSVTKSIQSGAIIDADIIGDGFITQNQENVISLTKDGIVSKVLPGTYTLGRSTTDHTRTILIGVSTAGVYEVSEDATLRLITAANEGTPVQVNASTIVYQQSISPAIFASYDLDTGDIKTFTPALTTPLDSTRVIAATIDSFLVQAGEERTTLLSNLAESVAYPEPTYSETIGSSIVSYSEENRNMSVISDGLSRNFAAISQNLSSKGIDPNLFYYEEQVVVDFGD